MSHLTTCYGSDLEAVADLVPDFDARSADALSLFNLSQWTDIAETLGFVTQLQTAAGALLKARQGPANLHAAALATFETWHRERPRNLSPAIPAAVRSARAKVRHDVLVGYTAAHSSELWFLDQQPASLRGSACFDRGATTLSGRAFLDDAPVNLLHKNRSVEATTACGWGGPVLLSLGTFPWVYGGRLYRTPPALDWDATATHNPAVTAMRLCASMWQPEGNLRQDARTVVYRYRHFREAVDLVLRDLPLYDPRRLVPGRLYRRGLLLHVEQASLELATVQTPLGPLAGNAHNYIVRRFAAFFALRRALLRDATRLSPALAALVAQNPDPCLRAFAPKGLATAEVRP
ncbi:hypothetical protein [Nannocystis pusilla]|uniref:Uncharacterized protein n=1 Tax=Nannocystis pusilla TaxID=889268 RepID=A0ABS7TM46_9BACT|nr:hypothetical protein [Nannocystis pusilla]MBZ5709285.1 hypothetical protein [Nannocystis pusilla]